MSGAASHPGPNPVSDADCQCGLLVSLRFVRQVERYGPRHNKSVGGCHPEEQPSRDRRP